MATIAFKKAERRSVKIKLGVTGPSGSGKTLSSLRLAKGLCPNGKIAVVDTENGSASLYSDRYEFDVLELAAPFTPDKYVGAIKAAKDAGYDVVIIDSFSHAWETVLDKKQAMDARGGSGFANWALAGKDLKAILTEILQSDIHIIATMRSKTEYSQEKDTSTGKTIVKKLGLAPVMRDGIEYEFSCVFDVAMDHQASASKDRTGMFADQIFMVTEETGEQIAKWLASAKPAEKVVTITDLAKAIIVEVDALGFLLSDGSNPKGGSLLKNRDMSDLTEVLSARIVTPEGKASLIAKVAAWKKAQAEATSQPSNTQGGTTTAADDQKPQEGPRLPKMETPVAA